MIPEVLISYSNIRDMENAYQLAFQFTKLGYTAEHLLNYGGNGIRVTLQGREITYETARSFVSAEAAKLQVEFLILENGIGLPPPAYETEGSAGMDMRAAIAEGTAILLEPGQRFLVPCGFSIALPRNYEAQVRPRSGLAWKHGVTVLNSPGTVDSDYRGEVMAMMINHGTEDYVISRGDRVAQMVINEVAQARFNIVKTLSLTTRGEGGFGSTGR